MDFALYSKLHSYCTIPTMVQLIASKLVHSDDVCLLKYSY